MTKMPSRNACAAATLAVLAALAVLPGTAAARQDEGGTLSIDVGNIRVGQGKVYVSVCPRDKFLKEDCPWSGNAQAHRGTTRVIVTGLPAGRYAVQAFLDENANGKVDRGLFGIPKEGVGFSNDAPIRLAPPKFADAVFDFDGTTQTIHFDLRYFTGPKGPKGF